MPRHSSWAKKRNRARQDQDNISYREARRREAEEARRRAEQASLRALVGPPRSVDDLLRAEAEDWCDRQLGEPTDTAVWSDIDLPEMLSVDIEELTVHQLALQPATLYSQEVDRYEGGTLLTAVFVEAELQLWSC